MSEGLLNDYVLSLQDNIQDHVDFVSQGQCSDFASYKHKVGLIKGLRQAETILHDAIRAASDEFQDYEDGTD